MFYKKNSLRIKDIFRKIESLEQYPEMEIREKSTGPVKRKSLGIDSTLEFQNIEKWIITEKKLEVKRLPAREKKKRDWRQKNAEQKEEGVEVSKTNYEKKTTRKDPKISDFEYHECYTWSFRRVWFWWFPICFQWISSLKSWNVNLLCCYWWIINNNTKK